MHNPDISTPKTRGNGHAEPADFDLPPLVDDAPDQRDADPRPMVLLDVAHQADNVRDIIRIAREENLPIYKHGPYLCRPALETRTRWDGQEITVGTLANYNHATLRHVLESVMRFMKRDGRKKKWSPASCPDELMTRVLGHIEDGAFPTIRGLLQTPILRPDMKLVVRPGYDPVTSHYLIATPSMPDMDLSRAGAERAQATLCDLVSEFPFATQRDRAVALSGLITPLVRCACDVVPGHLFTAPTQGSGKSLLVNLAAAIATGQPAYATLCHERQEETDKQLTGSVIEGRQIIALDNVMGDIRSPLLAQIMELPNVLARPLGTSSQIAIENSYCAYITGNNARVAGDNTRRLLVCRIDSQHENPIDRTFEKQHPLLRVAAARGEYIAACLTIVLAYQHVCVKDEPRPSELPPLPSYGRWSMLVREALVWLGEPDPVESIRESFDDDPGVSTLGTLLGAISRAPLVEPWLVKSALMVARSAGQEDLFDAMLAVADNGKGDIDDKKFGNFLRDNKDKKVGGRRLVIAVKATHNTPAKWKLG